MRVIKFSQIVSELNNYYLNNKTNYSELRSRKLYYEQQREVINTMELQQSPMYGNYIAALKWQVFHLEGVQMFYKHIPFTGGLLKIQRPTKLPSTKNLISFIHEHRIKTVAVEPIQKQTLSSYKQWCKTLEQHVRVVRSSYQPAKTILIDVTPTEAEIFSKFSEAKRRAVRKAQKNGITVRESPNIKQLIAIKNQSGGLFGFITTFGIDKLWPLAYPEHATTVLAYDKNDTIVGGVLLLFWNKTAFYWIAGASRKGKMLFAPTLLVWECLRIAKARGCDNFDFVGVWDERKPKEHTDWLGFTKFKEGFGGDAVYYPIY